MNRTRIRRRVVVSGRVQGVFFRDTVSRRARSLGVAGWVLNRSDGTVEAVLEGEPGAVAAMVEFCRLGPPAAVVSSVEVDVEPPEGIEGFVVRSSRNPFQ